MLFLVLLELTARPEAVRCASIGVRISELLPPLELPNWNPPRLMPAPDINVGDREIVQGSNGLECMLLLQLLGSDGAVSDTLSLTVTSTCRPSPEELL